MEQAIGQGAGDTLVEEDEHQGNFDSLVGQAMGVAAAVAFEQAVPLELAQVVAKLAEPVALGGEAVAFEGGLVELTRFRGQ